MDSNDRDHAIRIRRRTSHALSAWHSSHPTQSQYCLSLIATSILIPAWGCISMEEPAPDQHCQQPYQLQSTGRYPVDRSEVRNLQITGNDIEHNNHKSHGAEPEPTAEIYIDATAESASVNEVTIASNTIRHRLARGQTSASWKRLINPGCPASLPSVTSSAVRKTTCTSPAATASP